MYLYIQREREIDIYIYIEREREIVSRGSLQASSGQSSRPRAQLGPASVYPWNRKSRPQLESQTASLEKYKISRISLETSV